MRLIIIRHGESESNVKGKVEGRTQGRLSERGREQVRRLAQRLAAERIEFILSSDLRRARETTEEIAKYHQEVKIIYSAELQERNFGELEGRTLEECFVVQKKSGDSLVNFTPRGGEGFGDVERRVRNFLEEQWRFLSAETVLISGHASINRMLLKTLLDFPMEQVPECSQDNACVNILELENLNRVSEVLRNCIAHLQKGN